MKTPRCLLLILTLWSGLWLGAAHALPSVEEVQAATRRGDLATAEQMMREVVAARPDSARAHYVLAEILAQRRQWPAAIEHAARARALDPAIRFTTPARFESFERALHREQAAAGQAAAPPPGRPPQREAPAAGATGDGMPVWLLVVGAVILMAVVVGWRRRRAAPRLQPAVAGGYAHGGPPGFGGVPPAGAGGSGLMGMGMAAAGGVAAGMLAERLLHGGHDASPGAPRDIDAGTAGGLVPGSFDDPGHALGDIDFGSGDGWGGGDDLGGGSGGDW